MEKEEIIDILQAKKYKFEEKEDHIVVKLGRFITFIINFRDKEMTDYHEVIQDPFVKKSFKTSIFLGGLLIALLLIAFLVVWEDNSSLKSIVGWALPLFVSAVIIISDLLRYYLLLSKIKKALHLK